MPIGAYSITGVGSGGEAPASGRGDQMGSRTCSHLWIRRAGGTGGGGRP